MTEELNRKLLIVTGKGGVGKSSMAAALAYRSAARGDRTLLARADPHDRIWHLFAGGAPKRDVDFHSAGPNLDIVDIRPEAAMREYGGMVLHSERLYGAVFENRIASSFLRGTPGVHAWATLGKVCFHANPEMVGESARAHAVAYDRVVFDAPATGHMLDMLRVPLVIERTASGGLLRRGAEGALDVLRDPAKATWIIVSTAEAFSIREAIELTLSIRKDLPTQKPIGLLNRVEREELDVRTMALIELLRPGAAPAGYANLLRRASQRQSEQQAGTAQLANNFDILLEIPDYPRPHTASELANSLDNGEHGHRERGSI